LQAALLLLLLLLLVLPACQLPASSAVRSR
jgi:hypothetical protein